MLPLLGVPEVGDCSAHAFPWVLLQGQLHEKILNPSSPIHHISKARLHFAMRLAMDLMITPSPNPLFPKTACRAGSTSGLAPTLAP